VAKHIGRCPKSGALIANLKSKISDRKANSEDRKSQIETRNSKIEPSKWKIDNRQSTIDNHPITRLPDGAACRPDRQPSGVTHFPVSVIGGAKREEESIC
jgi:hypothetical protein